MYIDCEIWIIRHRSRSMICLLKTSSQQPPYLRRLPHAFFRGVTLDGMHQEVLVVAVDVEPGMLNSAKQGARNTDLL